MHIKNFFLIQDVIIYSVVLHKKKQQKIHFTVCNWRLKMADTSQVKKKMQLLFRQTLQYCHAQYVWDYSRALLSVADVHLTLVVVTRRKGRETDRLAFKSAQVDETCRLGAVECWHSHQKDFLAISTWWSESTTDSRTEFRKQGKA